MVAHKNIVTYKNMVTHKNIIANIKKIHNILSALKYETIKNINYEEYDLSEYNNIERSIQRLNIEIEEDPESFIELFSNKKAIYPFIKNVNEYQFMVPKKPLKDLISKNEFTGENTFSTNQTAIFRIRINKGKCSHNDLFGITIYNFVNDPKNDEDKVSEYESLIDSFNYFIKNNDWYEIQFSNNLSGFELTHEFGNKSIKILNTILALFYHYFRNKKDFIIEFTADDAEKRSDIYDLIISRIPFYSEKFTNENYHIPYLYLVSDNKKLLNSPEIKFYTKVIEFV